MTALSTKIDVGRAHVVLPTTLLPVAQQCVAATCAIPRGTCLFECANMELHPTHLTTGQFLVKHSLASNTVFVEGCLISLADIAAGETLTVNMCYMVYDMTKLFPETYVTDNRGFKFLDEAVKQFDLYLCEPPVRAQAMRDGWIVVPTNPILTVRPNGDMGQTAYAVGAIPSGTLLFHTGTKGLIVPFPTMYTICVGEKRHLLFGDAAECIAHSCDPNVHVVVRSDETLEFRTCKDVEDGGMMSFCYSTTEWTMNSTFPCLCGSEFCGKYIRGFQNLTDADRQRLWPLASDYIRNLANGSK